MATAKRRVLLLFGGRSAEHDVSRVTAVAVARALDRDRYDVVPVAITTDGRWLLADSRAARHRGGARGAAERVPRSTAQVAPAVGGARRRRRVPAAARSLRRGRHRAGPARAGRPAVRGLGRRRVRGGDGQGDDEARVRRCRTARTRATIDFRDGHDRAELAAQVEADLGYPCFVKPANLGSSVGVSKARDRAEFDAASTSRSRTTSGSWSRRRSPGREIELGVLGDDPPTVSVAGEIVPGDDFYSYADKYEADDAELLVPGAAHRRAARGGAAPRAPRLRGLPVRGHGPGRPVPPRTTARSS